MDKLDINMIEEILKDAQRSKEYLLTSGDCESVKARRSLNIVQNADYILKKISGLEVSFETYEAFNKLTGWTDLENLKKYVKLPGVK